MAKLNVPWSNVNSEKDIINALAWNRGLLRILGIWPLVYSNTSTIEKILATVLFALCWSALSFLLIPMIMLILSKHSATSDKIKILGPLSYVCIVTLKYFFLVIHHKGIQQCIRILSNDWRSVQQEDHRKIMIKNAAKSHVLSKFSIIFMYCGGLWRHVMMPFLSHAIKEQNATTKPMPFAGYDNIFNFHFMPVYVFVLCAQWFSGIVMFNVTTAVCCLAAMFVAHACGQIEIVMNRIESFIKDAQSNNHMKQYMAIIVKHHVQSLRFSVNIDNILREIGLIEIVGATLMICLLEYYCITEWDNNDSIAIFTYFFLLVSFVFNVFTLCYIGEQLTSQCSKIGYTSYGIEWYHLPGKIALDLTLIISISHHPVKISAGKIVSLSFSSFGSVLKTSITYLNLLRKFV